MDLVTIGKTQKPHGVNGAIRLYIKEEFLPEIENLEVLFLKTAPTPVPYFIEELGLGENLTVKFEDIDSREAAKLIASKEIFARKSDLQLSEEERFELSSDLHYKFLLNYQLVDENLGPIGTIVDVLEFPQQEMAVVDYKQKEILIPLNEAFIGQIFKDKKQIHVSLPDGLVDI